MLQKVHFQNFRCFKNTTISFKDLTIIVGKNNAGKSTIIEALRLITLARNKSTTTNYVFPRTYGLKIHDLGFKINHEKLRIDLRTVIYFYDETTARITAFFKDKSKIILYIDNEIIFACLYDIKGQNIQTKSQAFKCNFSLINILPQIGLIKENEKFIGKDRVVADKETYLSSRHFRNEILLYKEQFYTNFCELAESTWPGLKIIELSYNPVRDDYICMLIEDDRFTAELGLMGSGIQMWLQIIWFICRSNDCETIILDEPDVYMHPDLQRKLLLFIKNKFKQVIIATHSVEIISEVEPKNIVTIDKKSRSMKYANNKKAVQIILDRIGSVHNLFLVRLANSKKCLFVEGGDLKILSKFHRLLNPDSDISLEIFPNISLGGWSRLDEAFGTSKLMYEETDNHIKCYCILDRDYFTEDKIQEQMERAEDCHLILHVWSKKEIENYLIKPSVLFRISKLKEEKYEEFLNALDKILNEYKDNIIDQISNQIYIIQKRGKSVPTCNAEARQFVEQRWTSLDNKICLISGKELISRINIWMREEYGQSCSLNKMLNNMRPDEVDIEIRQLIQALIM